MSHPSGVFTSKKKFWKSTTFAHFLLLSCILFLWQISNDVLGITRFIIVPPTEVVIHMYKGLTVGSPALPEFYTHLYITLYELLGAYVLALTFGLSLGILLGSSKLLGDAYEPLVLAWWSVPWIIIFPLMILILGVGSATRMSAGFLLGLSYILFNTSTGLRGVDRKYLVLARSIGMRFLPTFFKVILPAAIPTIVTGLRLGFSSCYIGVIVGGLLLANEGLGFILEWSSRKLYTPELLGTIMIILLIGICCDKILTFIEAKVWQWRKG